jgi:hypothetical protein
VNRSPFLKQFICSRECSAEHQICNILLSRTLLRQNPGRLQNEASHVS